MQSAGLRVGQTLQGFLAKAGNEWVIQASGLRLPVPEGATLPEGQPLRITVLEAGETLRVQVQALPASAQAATSSFSPSILSELAKALATALGLRATSEETMALILGLKNASATSLRQVLSTLGSTRSLGTDLEELMALLGRALSGGILPRSTLAPLQRFLSLLQPEDAEGFGQLLKTMSQEGQIPARLAAGAEAGILHQVAAQIREGLLNQLMLLDQNKALREFLAQNRLEKRFSEILGRLTDRLHGADVQVARGANHPYYFFLDLPFGKETGIEHAQAHFFGSNEKGSKKKAAVSSIVLDVAASHLGNLWITLGIQAARCQCTVRATAPEVIAAMEASRDELRRALDGAGFKDSLVAIEFWDGNRLRETGALIRQLSGLDLSA